MAATHYYTQVTLEHDSALPEDRSVNTFAVQLNDAAVVLTELAAWHTALTTFYNAIDGLFSSSISAVGTIKSYDRADPTPRVPKLSTALAIVAGSAMLPAECAICVSFQAVTLAGAPQSRRRGRVFIGPLNSSVNDTSTGRPDTTQVTTLQNAADALVTTSKGAAEWYWEVWSQANLSGREVDNGWIDNAFDTQRRRGLRPTSRVLFS